MTRAKACCAPVCVHDFRSGTVVWPNFCEGRAVCLQRSDLQDGKSRIRKATLSQSLCRKEYSTRVRLCFFLADDGQHGSWCGPDSYLRTAQRGTVGCTRATEREGSALVQRVAGRIGNDISLNYRSFPRITVIDPAGRVYMPSGVAAIVMFLSSEGVLQYCTRATDPTNEWLTCLASSMTR